MSECVRACNEMSVSLRLCKRSGLLRASIIISATSMWLSTLLLDCATLVDTDTDT